MSEVKVNKISPRSGTDVTLGDSGDTFTVPTGVTLDTSNSTVTLPDGSVTTAKIDANAVTNAKLNNDIISGATELATEPADTDEFLVSDAGTLKRIDYSLIKGGGITEADQWRLTTLLTGNANPISSNLERNDSSGFNYIGTGMTESSGVFSFPSTGIYCIIFQGTFRSDSADSRYCRLDLDVTTDNSNYTAVAYGMTGLSYVTSSTYDNAMGQYIFDVTDTSTHKVRFAVEYAVPATTSLVGTTTENYTSFTFIRLGDT